MPQCHNCSSKLMQHQQCNLGQLTQHLELLNKQANKTQCCIRRQQYLLTLYKCCNNLRGKNATNQGKMLMSSLSGSGLLWTRIRWAQHKLNFITFQFPPTNYTFSFANIFSGESNPRSQSEYQLGRNHSGRFTGVGLLTNCHEKVVKGIDRSNLI